MKNILYFIIISYLKNKYINISNNSAIKLYNSYIILYNKLV